MRLGVTDCDCGCVRRLFHGSILAAEMRQVLKDKIGFRCCGGVATNKVNSHLNHCRQST
jgi:hypothetical protein